MIHGQRMDAALPRTHAGFSIAGLCLALAGGCASSHLPAQDSAVADAPVDLAAADLAPIDLAPIDEVVDLTPADGANLSAANCSHDEDPGLPVAQPARAGQLPPVSRRISQPMLYRIEGRPTPPRAVSTCGLSLLVNGDGDATVAPAASEVAVNGATHSTWYYDENAKRLVVKLVERNGP